MNLMNKIKILLLLSFHSLPFLILLDISHYFAPENRGMVDGLKFTFKPRDVFSRNGSKKVATGFKKMFFRKLRDRFQKISRMDKLPKIPSLKIRRIIQQADSSKTKYDPCQVVKDICLNGGVCHSLEDAGWYCDCPVTHYGKACEFWADQSKCSDHLCQNNATCYSIKTPRTVPNINLTAQGEQDCLEKLRGEGRGDFKCNVTIAINYRCWCRKGFEGDFCEFNEAERCCTEDYCNHHGLIRDVFHTSKEEVCDAKAHCKCTCEEYYQGDRCERINPCRDFDCYNGGNCTLVKFENNNKKKKEKKMKGSREEDEEELFNATCKCPDSNKFKLEGVKIGGEQCEQIEMPDSDCAPCKCTGGYKKWLHKQEPKEWKAIISKFVKYCGDDTDELCENKLGNLFCLHPESSECEVTVANFSEIKGFKDKPLLLIPKCQCDPTLHEGDFCEHQLLDECDRKDLEMNEGAGKGLGKINAHQKLMKTVGTEQFLRNLKNKLWDKTLKKPEGSQRPMVARAFERAIREKGMRTFCGPHGLCRPYDPDEGLVCKCDPGYMGNRCDVKDPCWEFKCPDHSICIAVPVLDEDESSDEGTGNLTQTCICKTSQEVDPRNHQCISKQNETYEACFDKSQKPKCRNDAHCYPCKLDERAAKKAGVKGGGRQLLATCNEMERARGYRCICTPGLEPPDCQNSSQPCDLHRCQNGASCMSVPEPDNPLNYECKCRLGYNGTLCERVEDYCIHAGSTCGNGTCVEDPTWRRGFRCDCFSGYWGFNCELIVRSDWIAYFNNNYRWTYPLSVLSVLTPVVLVLMILRDRGISVGGVFVRVHGFVVGVYGRILNLLRRRKGKYTLLEGEKDKKEAQQGPDAQPGPTKSKKSKDKGKPKTAEQISERQQEEEELLMDPIEIS